MSESISKRYARALVDLSRERGVVDETGGELRRFAEVVEASENLKRLMYNPTIGRGQRKRIAEELAARLELDQNTINFLKLLIDNRRMRLLSMIERLYTAMADEIAGRVRGTITSATPLSEEHRRRLEQTFSERMGRQVVLDAGVDPKLLGGLVTRIGDEVYDGSLRTGLARIGENLTR